MTPLTGTAPPRAALAAGLGVFAACSLLLVHGFLETRVLADGLRAAWAPTGARHFALFLGLAFAAAFAAGRKRGGLAALSLAWLAAAHGLGALASLALVAAAAYGLGFRILQGASCIRSEGMAPELLRVATGLAAIVGTVQVLVHWPINSTALYLALLGGAAGYGRHGIRAVVARAAAARGAVLSVESRFATAALVTVLAAHSAVAALPEVASDALAVHLMVPQQVASLGEWSFDFRAYVFALIPMGADWLYTAAHFLGGEAAARLCNLALLVAVALSVRQELARRLPGPLASWMTAGCAAAPIVFQESFSLWVENLLTLFLLSAALVVARSWRRPAGGDVAALALCAGGALMTKSLGILGLPLVAAMAWSLARAPGLPRRARVSRASLGVVVLLAVGAFPYLQAEALTGNPLFPYFNDVFRSPYYGERFVDARWIGHGGADLLYRMTFESSTFGELYDGALGFHHLLLLPLGLLVAFLRWPRAARLVLAVSLAGIAAFVSGTQYIRYLYPFLWAAAIVEGEALGLLAGVPRLRRPVLAIAGAVFIANLAFMATGFYLLREFPVEAVFSRDARERFVTREAPYRRLNAIVNASAGTAARVLYVSTPFGAFLEGVPLYANWYSPARLAALDADSLDGVGRMLADERVSHVVLDGERELPVLREWLRLHARKLATLGDSELYALDDADAGTP